MLKQIASLLLSELEGFSMLHGFIRMMVPPTLFAALLLLAGCTSPTAGLNPVPSIQSTEYTLISGDKIRVTIPDLQKVDAEFLIDQTGTISLPLVKEVKVVGLTLRGAEKAIEQALLDKRILVRPSVTIQAISLRPVYILGEVGKPGEYDFKEGLTVFAVVSQAGGYTYRADTQSVIITRNVDGKIITGKAVENTIVMPGDQIRVVEKWF
jgi:protein involved in polysaccharide export with SLBB domain